MVNATSNLVTKVETQGVAKASQDLEKVAKSAGKAETATQTLNKSMTAMAKSFSGAVLGMTKGIEALVHATNGATRSQMKMASEAREFAEAVYIAAQAQDVLAQKTKQATTAAANQNRMLKSAQDSLAKQNSRFYTGNIVAQFQDIGVTAAMGMNPLTIALQQGTQLSAILDTMEKPLVGIVNGFRSLFSSTTLLTVGLTTLLAVGIQTVDWMSAVNTVAGYLADGLDFVADNIGSLVAGLSVLGLATLPSAIGAVSAGFVALGGAVITATKAVLAFTASHLLGLLSSLANPLGIATVGFLALGTAAVKAETGLSGFQSVAVVVRQTLNSMIGSVAAITAGLTGFVNLFRGGSFKDIKEAINDSLNDDYISGFGDSIRKAAQGLREYISTSKEAEDPWEKINEHFETSLRTIEQETALIGKEGWEAEKLRYQHEMINTAIRAGIDPYADRIAMVKLENQALNLTMAKMRQIDAQQAVDFAELESNAKKSAEAYGLQIQQLSMYGSELYKSQEYQKLLNEAESKGIVLTKKRKDALESAAESIAKQRYEYESLSYKISTASSITAGFFKDMRNGLKEGENAWEVFGNAVMRVLDSIIDALLDYYATQVVVGLMAGATNGAIGGANFANAGGTPIQGHLNGYNVTGTGGTGANISSTNAMYIGGFAKGGTFTNGVVNNPTIFKFARGSKFGVMGEAGPEAVMPLTRSSDGSLGVRAVGGNGGSEVVVNVINNSNATARTEERQTSHGKEIDVIIDQMVSGKISEQGSSTNRALQAYNNRKLVSR